MPELSSAHRRITPFTALKVWLTAALFLFVGSILFGILAAAFHGGAGASALLSDPAKSPLLNDPTWISLGTLVNETGALCAFCLWWFLLRPPGERFGTTAPGALVPLARPRPADVFGALLLTFGTAPFAEAAGELMHRLVQNDVTASRVVIAAARGASDAQLVLLLICLSLVPAVVEELLFRGLITAAFRHNLVLAMVVPSLLFGLFHLEPTQAAGTVFLGAAFGFARLCTDSLSVSMLAHGIYNAVVLLVVRFSTGTIDREIRLAPLLFGALMVVAGASLLLHQRRARLGTVAAAL